MAFGDRSDEREVETSAENRSPAGEAVGAGAPCGDVESVGVEHPTGGPGEKSPDFDRVETTGGRNDEETSSRFCYSPVSENDKRSRA